MLHCRFILNIVSCQQTKGEKHQSAVLNALILIKVRCLHKLQSVQMHWIALAHL